MTTFQEWLNNKYPNKKQTTEIRSSENLRGSLNISDYPNLEKIHISWQKNLTNLQINNCPNLKELYVKSSQLTSLDLTNFPNLEYLSVSQNSLTNLDLSNNLKLEKLYISNNNFSEQDLSFLKNCVNLKDLSLRNNKFHGSLEYLKNMSKLEYLDISDTDIDSGLEYLPESVEEFKCSANYRKDAKCKKFQQKLNPNIFSNKEEFFQKDIQKWKEVNTEKIAKARKEIIEVKDQKITQLEEEIQELKTKTEQSSIPTQPNLSQQSEQLLQEIASLKEQINPLKQQGKQFVELEVKLSALQEQNTELVLKNQELETKLLVRLNLSQQSTQLNQNITQSQKQINKLRKETLDLKDQIWNKTIELEKNPSAELEKEIQDLKNQLAEKDIWLAQKEQELVQLLTENKKLIEKSLYHLKTISNFRTKQKEANNLYQLVENGNSSSLKKFGEIQKEVGKLEHELDTIIQKQSINFQDKHKELLKKEEAYRNKPRVFVLQEEIAVQLGAKSTQEKTIDKLEKQSTNIFKQSILTEAKDFLNSKQTFLNTRQGTIERLKNCYNKLSKTINRTLANTSSAGEIIGEAGEGIGGLETFGIPNLIGGLTVWLSKFSEGKFSDKRLEEFKKYLENDENKLFWFNEKYNSLIKLIRKNKEISSDIIEILKLENKLEDEETKIFDIDHQVKKIIGNKLGWKKCLTVEDTFKEMEEIINSLADNWDRLEMELKEEKKQFKNIVNQFGAEEIREQISQQQPQIIHNPPKNS